MSNSRTDQHAPENYGFLHVATVTSPHGICGEVKATVLTDFAAHRLSVKEDLQRYLLLLGRRYPRPVGLRGARRAPQPNVWILALDGLTSRDDFKRLRLQGARIYVRAEAKPPLARGEFVVADLTDLRVAVRDDSAEHYITQTTRRGEIRAGQPIGIVESVITKNEICEASGGGAAAAAVANDVIQIALFSHDNLLVPEKFTYEIPEEAERALVPFVKELVPVVDQSKALIVIDPPPGLLDITVVNRISKPRPPRALLMAAPTLEDSNKCK